MKEFLIDECHHSVADVKTLLDPNCRLVLGENAKKRIIKCS